MEVTTSKPFLRQNAMRSALVMTSSMQSTTKSGRRNGDVDVNVEVDAAESGDGDGDGDGASSSRSASSIRNISCTACTWHHGTMRCRCRCMAPTFEWPTSSISASA